MDDEIIVLLDEDGTAHDFQLIEIVEIEKVAYVLLLPVDAPEDGVVVLRMEKDEAGEDVYVAIEDDDEFEQVREAIEDLFEEEQH